MEGFNRKLVERGGRHQVVRRVHIVYFLSRNGMIEHPHLIRVRQIYKNGVHLRDVKRWLSELRGKEFPNSFAWSYKRRYKNGYIWQDLMDDDLVTPVSDSEYILKGSHIPQSQPVMAAETLSSSSSCGEKTRSSPISKPDPPPDTGSPPSETQPPPPNQQVDVENFLDLLHELSPKPPPHLDDKSPGATSYSSSDAYVPKPTYATFNIDIADRPEPEERHPGEDKRTTPVSQQQQRTKCDGSSPHPIRSKSNSSGRAAHVLRNLLTCRAVETNDAALLPIKYRRLSIDSLSVSRGDDDALGGYQRLHRPQTPPQKPPSSGSRKQFGGKSSKKAGEFEKQKDYKTFRPITKPKCSQCGKAFNPEKLHLHMKSCSRALKGRGRSLSKYGEATTHWNCSITERASMWVYKETLSID